MRQSSRTYALALLVCSTALLASHASAQLSLNDWLTAGGYGSFYVRTTDDMAPEDKANAELFKALWKKTTGSDVDSGPENVHKLINVALGAEGLTADVVDPAVIDDLGEGYFLNTYRPSSRHVAFGALPQLVIAGRDAASTRAGIYGLLRRAFGSEWFAPGVAEIRRAPYRMEKCKEAVKPAFAFREIGFTPANTPEETEFRIANGLRAATVPMGLGRDSSLTLIPPEKLFDTHPEFFAEIDSHRIALKDLWRNPKDAQTRAAENGELCAFAPGLADAIVDAIREAIAAPAKSADPLLIMRRARAGWLADRKIWSLSPMANTRLCDCAMCRGMREKDLSPMGPWLTLVNEVAAKLDAAFPGEGYRVLTHASGPWLPAPVNTKAARNVIVTLSTNACDFSSRLEDRATPENAAFVDALKAWSSVADHIWVADCLTALRTEPTPFPVEPVLQANLRFYAQNNVQGVYFQALGPKDHDDDFSALKYFLAARLLWSPDAPVDELTQRFVTAYYGPAADAVNGYLAARKPGPGLSPKAPPQPALLEARKKAQETLRNLLSTLDDATKARVQSLLPATN